MGFDGVITGLGCMRLSDEDVPESRALETLQTALSAGVTLLDTADVYAPNAQNLGHNEKLVAKAVSSWNGPRKNLIIATKGGLRREGAQWFPDGRATHLQQACEESLKRLGTIDLYQLHTPDPSRPFKTSVRALASLKNERLISRLGLCNVSLKQLKEAQDLVDIDAVQVELNLWNDEAIRSGVVRECVESSMLLLAHTPLGGPRSGSRHLKEPLLVAIAEKHVVTPQLVGLAYLASLSPFIVPLPGATRPPSALEAAKVRSLSLSEDELRQLDARFPTHASLRAPPQKPKPQMSDGEVVLLMGIPGAGKSTLVQPYLERGYARLNRDSVGGLLKDLIPKLEELLKQGQKRVVLDNTYATRESRQRVVEAANKFGVPARCVWLTTSLEEAQINATWRMLDKYGHLLDPLEIRSLSKKDPNTFVPRAQFHFRDELESPTVAEGLSSVEEVPFSRRWPEGFTHNAVLLELDDVVRKSSRGARTPMDPDDVVILPGAKEALSRWKEAGYPLLGTDWLPEVESKALSVEKIPLINQRTSELLGMELDVLWCPHQAGPPVCWCRKPLPGMGVVHVRKHKLDVKSCVVVGKGSADKTFSARLGMRYLDANEFLTASPQ